MLKRIITTGAIVASLLSATVVTTTSAMAHKNHTPTWNQTQNSYLVRGQVVETWYKVKHDNPTYRNVKQCKWVNVPIYGNGSRGNEGDVIVGAIIGGILGKQITQDDGGAVVGAIIGGAIGSNHNGKRVIGHQRQKQCWTERQEVSTGNNKRQYFAQIRIQGKLYKVKTNYRLPIGSTVHMYMPY